MPYTVPELIEQVEIATGRKVVFCRWPNNEWAVGFEDFDLGDPMGYGATQEAALADLMALVWDAAS